MKTPKIKIDYPAMEGIRLVPRPPRLKPQVRRDIFGDPDLKLIKKNKAATTPPTQKQWTFPRIKLSPFNFNRFKKLLHSSKEKTTSFFKRSSPSLIIASQKSQQQSFAKDSFYRKTNKSSLGKNLQKLLLQKITLPKLPPLKRLFSLQNGLISVSCVAIILLLVFSANNTYNHAQAAKDNAFQDASSASQYLKNALISLEKSDFKNAQANFQKAEFSFADAKKSIRWIGVIPRQVIEKTPHFGTIVQSGNNTIEAGYHLSRAAQYLLKFSEPIFLDNGKSFLPDNYETNVNPKNSLTTRLKENKEYFSNGLKEITKANNNFKKVAVEELPENIQPIISQLKNNLPEIENKLTLINEVLPQIINALGSEENRHYLILFQNNTEIRATGGFIGSYALVHVYQGQVRKFFVDNVYNPDGICTVKVPAPKPFQKMHITKLKMRDSNWSPDFPTSAQKVAWFYEHSGGESVDGVIALDNSFIENLLKATGPITLKKYQTTLTAENFTQVTQLKVEKEYTNEKNPKEFLVDLAPLLLEKLISDKSKWFEYLKILDQNVKQKHFLAFSYHPIEQNLLFQNNLAGEIKEFKDKYTDYLSVINSNLAGNKSTAVIKETIQSKTEIEENGEIIRTITITHKHKGIKYFRAGDSIIYTRVLVPEGSVLLESKGNRSPIEIGIEKGKTVFGTWLITKIKKTSQITLQYRLPFKLKVSIFKPQQKYVLYAQKQSGSRGSQLDIILETIAPLRIELKNSRTPLNSNINYSTILDTDKEIVGIIKK